MEPTTKKPQTMATFLNNVIAWMNFEKQILSKKFCYASLDAKSLLSLDKEKYKIITITDIAVGIYPVGHKKIQLVKINVGKDLACQIANRHATRDCTCVCV